jgi:Trypsin-like peptidase domain
MVDKISNSELLQHSTVRLECELDDNKISVGTGFYFAFQKTESSWDRLVIVTNKHVVKDSKNLTIYLTPFNNEKQPDYCANFSTTLNISETDWLFHPDDSIDLCILPFDKFHDDLVLTKGDFFIFAYSKEYLADKEKLESLSAIETITMIGYPNGIWDKSNNIPVTRQGITASHPKLNYNGKAEILIDCSCFPGSSGSPVLVFNPGGHTTKEGHFDMRGRLVLLGVLYAGPQFQADGKIIVQPISTLPDIYSLTNIPLNLGYIIKSEKILDFDKLF